MLAYSSIIEMNQLLSPPSLPQRLCQCAFQPVLLTLVLSSLLTTWTTYAILQSHEGGSPASTVNNQTRTSTVTYHSVSTTTATSSTTAPFQDLYTVNESAIQEIADEYTGDKVGKLNDLVNLQLLPQTYDIWRNSLRLWNESLNQTLETKKADYNNMLALRDGVTTELLGQSQRINDTLDLLSETALTVGNTNGQQVIQNLSLNYWFVDDMFAQVPKDLEALENVSQMIALPTIPNATFSFTTDNITDALQNAASNLTAALEQINASQNATASAKYSQSLHKRSDDSTTVSRKTNTLYKQPCIRSVCICILYAFTVVLLCIYEWIKYSWEKEMFNIQAADALEVCDIELELETSKIKLQQRLRSFARQLAFSVREIVVYKFSNWVTGERRASELHWKRNSAFYWWIWSSGKTLWILTFCTILHWQAVVSMTPVRNNADAQVSNPASYKRDTGMQATNSSYDTSPVYSTAVWACNAFENEIDSLLTATIEADLQLFLNKSANDINSQMSNLVTQTANFTQIPWPNITISLEIPETKRNESLTAAIITRALNLSLSLTTTPLHVQNLQFPIKAAQEPLQDHFAPPLGPIYQWALIALTITALIHHLFGFLIIPRLQ